MSEIKAIKTKYNGYVFRSRLDARVAVLFDILEIKYLYELEGFYLGDDIYYLPDFYLPDMDIWVEVKGVMSELDFNKIKKFIEAGNSMLIVFNDLSFSFFDLTYYYGCDLDLDDLHCESDTALVKCGRCGKYYFVHLLGEYSCKCCQYYNGNSTFRLSRTGNWTSKKDDIYNDKNDIKMQLAFKKALQARFEYGENKVR